MLDNSKEIYVPGLATYSCESIKKNLARKLKDMAARLENDDCHMVTEDSLAAFSALWVALSEETGAQ